MRLLKRESIHIFNHLNWKKGCFLRGLKKRIAKIAIFLIGKDAPSHLSCTISMVTGKIIYWITWWYFAQIATAKPTHLEQRIRKFECPIGNFRSRTLQIRGSLTSMKLVIPSQVTMLVKGVETRRRAPTFENRIWWRYSPDHESRLSGAAKAEAVRKSCGQQWPYRFNSDPGHQPSQQREGFFIRVFPSYIWKKLGVCLPK